MPVSEVAKEEDENKSVRKFFMVSHVSVCLVTQSLSGFVLNYFGKDICLVNSFGR